ncbi:hypothetical protein PLICRDRAFT_430448 [Plicaturopsis crispa FD-325 SS-3]|uniref:Uncharacterized protein n=1 Tax=Plicaturopsis crispa FD-325 SS-3 TaxID=944288 RepID=A0A0C9T6Y0_PLICR|nr:hypothetical protein PLICRDRAFT_430448 [Plicaturopsis crispa FD-325 SS-3]
MVAQHLLLLSLFAVAARANDWSTPCFNGECSYELPKTNASSPHAVMKITGSPDAITDITEAAGWIILGCDQEALTHDVRIVCQSNDTSSTGCGHLYQNVDVVGKIVRLPEDCGKSPFARVVNLTDHDDQSIPDDVSKRLIGSGHQVKMISLDTNFHEVDANKTGNVQIAIQGTTIQGATGSVVSQYNGTATGNSFINAGIKSFLNWNKNITKTLTPIDVVKPNFTLIDESIDCPATQKVPAFRAAIDAQMDIDAHAEPEIGIVASGSLIPPKISHFALFAGLTADIKGSLRVNVSAGGTLASKRIPLFTQALGGIDIPGIITLGPTFTVTVGTAASLDVDLDFEVDLAYKVDNAQMFFPPSDAYPNKGSFVPSDTPFKLSLPPSAPTKTKFTANLIPELDFGLKAFGGVAEATVFLNMNAAANLVLDIDAPANTTATKAAVAAGKDVDVDGCASINGDFSVNAGARGSFFSFFNDATSVPLFNEQFDLFSKCFGNATSTEKRTLPARSDVSVVRAPRPSARALNSHFSRRSHHQVARSLVPKGEQLACILLQAAELVSAQTVKGGSAPSSTIAAPQPTKSG